MEADEDRCVEAKFYFLKKDSKISCCFMMFYPSFPEPSNIEGNAESARVIGLMPWMDYEFQVIASNILGSGEPSMASHTVRTQQAGKW